MDNRNDTVQLNARVPRWQREELNIRKESPSAVITMLLEKYLRGEEDSEFVSVLKSQISILTDQILIKDQQLAAKDKQFEIKDDQISKLQLESAENRKLLADLFEVQNLAFKNYIDYIQTMVDVKGVIGNTKNDTKK
ncbi:hypothetical protein SAMN04488589_1744 [Methanolobus vulcani]|uniref:Uncharacterized protein n=1 Tax=Methanolobus vulcani TaxID=38026 RepID=A0A7Z7AX13_9EURY|nr:hypothetical protein [Methanolobus vulcani]SDF93706.1 hypothetical protein SAMN04488589_1744 [Methanolobus vulcani]